MDTDRERRPLQRTGAWRTGAAAGIRRGAAYPRAGVHVWLRSRRWPLATRRLGAGRAGYGVRRRRAVAEHLWQAAGRRGRVSEIATVLMTPGNESVSKINGMGLGFEIISASASGGRRAALHLPHGIVQTPVFMPVGPRPTRNR